MNSKHLFEPHLVVKHLSLPPAAEWRPEMPGWIFAQIATGQAYVMHAQKNQQLETGCVVAFPWLERGCIRASQLDWASLYFFQVHPERLAGLVTLSEQQLLRKLAARNHSPPRVFPADHPVSDNFRISCKNPASDFGSLSGRLRLLQIFTDALGDDLKAASEVKTHAAVSIIHARARMLELLKQIPAAALLDLTLDELVKQVQCTPRHVSRVFSEIVGMSFREKQSEIRLQRAQELLATTESKILEVALESGFQSVSLFNLMFKRRFGITPGEWRERVTAGNMPKRRMNRTFLVGV